MPSKKKANKVAARSKPGHKGPQSGSRSKKVEKKHGKSKPKGKKHHGKHKGGAHKPSRSKKTPRRRILSSYSDEGGCFSWLGRRDSEGNRITAKSKHSESKGEPRDPLLEEARLARIQGEVGKRIYCKRLMRGFTPYKWFAILTGNFPMYYQKKPNGSYEFMFGWAHWHTWLYILNALFTIYFFGAGIYCVYAYASRLEIFPHQKTAEHREQAFYEMVLVKRHFVFLWSLAAAACCSGIGIVHTFMRRGFAPTVYTCYWKAIRLLHFDLQDGVKSTGYIMIIFYVLTTSAVILMGMLRFAPVAQSIPLLVGNFLFRGYFGFEYDGIWILDRPYFRLTFQILGGFSILLIYSSSKALILLFIFHCKVLRNAFAAWNGRTYIFIMKAAKFFVTEEGGNRLKLIYKDHCVILDMMEALNRNFATVTETYYALQLASSFFELYFFLRTARFGTDMKRSGSSARGEGDFFIRPYDWVPGLIIAMQSIIFVLVTSKIASDVGEEALSGVDIVRRRVFLHRKTDHDLFFQLSMQNSFDSYRRFDISTGQYEYINKDWIQGWINTVAGYFIILYQFQPLMDEPHKKDWDKRKKLAEFLNEVEMLEPSEHWTTLKPKPPPTFGPMRVIG